MPAFKRARMRSIPLSKTSSALMSISKIKHRVLIVEDDRASRKIMTLILEQAGYKVIECLEGREAVEIAAINPPVLMIVDVMLPDMRGTQVVEELCDRFAFRFTKFIFVTGILSHKTSQPISYFNIKGKRVPALSKPIDKTLLLSLLEDSIAASIVEKTAADDGPIEAAIPELAESETLVEEPSEAPEPAKSK